MIFYLLTFAALGLSIWAQFKVKGNFEKYSKVEASSGKTGAEVARQILDRNGLYDVPVEPVRGTLTDHYDPTTRVV
ncbi:zinc metallopeptidase, partial [Bacillus sonorensis]